MNAKPYLESIAEHFAGVGLDAVMIGNAAAAINGAPVTTLAVDFLVEQTSENYRKLAVVDILFKPSGGSDFAAWKRNSTTMSFGGHTLRIAALADIIASKKAAARPKDLASIPILEMTLDEKLKQDKHSKPSSKRTGRAPRPATRR